VRHGKGDKPRHVRLAGVGLAHLKVWLAVRGAAPGLVFSTGAGRGLTTSGVRRLMARLGRRAGLGKRSHFHALRHAFTVAHVRASTPLPLIQRALGHGSLATTAAYCATLEPAEVLEAMGRDVWGDEAA